MKEQQLFKALILKKIKGGITGFLRQEFHELEVLDDVTRLAFNNKLPNYIGGVTRKQIIYTYRKWKGVDHIPKRMSGQIKWSKQQPWEHSEPNEEEIWKIVEKQNKLKVNENKDKPNRKVATATEKKETYQIYQIYYSKRNIYSCKYQQSSKNKAKKKKRTR